MSRASMQGLLAHARLIINGVLFSPNVATKLITFYARLGDVGTARKVFDRINDKNVVAWTAQISAYTQNKCYEDAMQLFSNMLGVGVKPNQFTFGSVLKASCCLRSFWRGLQIQSCVQKSRFMGNLYVQSALVDLHSKCGRMDDARYLFDAMLERDMVSWNAMVGGYAAQGCVDDSFQLFHDMMTEGLPPDRFTLGSLLKVSGRTNNFIKVSQLHGFVEKLGFGVHLELIGSIIDAYVRCGRLESANSLYNTMEKKDITSCTALMNGFVQNAVYRTQAMNLFKEIHRKQYTEIDDVMLCSVLNMSANATSLVMGRQLHAFAVKCKPSYDVAVGNSLIDMYAKSGEIEDASRAFGEMKEKNVISWTSLISGYGKHGYGCEAVELCKEMEDEGLMPNDITFLSVLFACSHSGLAREGLEFFNNMINKHHISPRSEHFSCMVDLFARAGQLEDVHDMICKNNVKPNLSLWGSILGACNLYGNVALGESIATRLINLSPDKSVNYAVLGNIYAATGAWHNYCKIRNLMSERKLKKTPGCSSIDSPRNLYLMHQ
ncbi:Pentatricopeptide repeat-containing protein At3g20730 [Linum perenne]